MRLNPQKFVFAVEAGKLLGFMLTNRGIEANLDKCKAILEMKSPSSMKDVQCLMGRITSLSRFLVALARKASPFFSLLTKENNFEWTSECEAAFQEFKFYLSSPPILCKSEIGKPLFLYLSISNSVIAGILVLEDAKQQFPVYFVNKTSQRAEVRYQKLEKVGFSFGRCSASPPTISPNPHDYSQNIPTNSTGTLETRSRIKDGDLVS